MFEFEFIRRAFLCGILMATVIPLIGIVMVNRKTSMVGDALSHTSLAGVAIGLIFGINPLRISIIVCILAAILIERIRNKFPDFGDMATALVMSMGLGLASILSDIAPGGNAFETYLFGSISTVSKEDVLTSIAVFIIVVYFSIKYYFSILSVTYNGTLAKLSGVNTRRINLIFTVLSAVTVAVGAKITGALLVSSLMVLPVTTALLISKSYKSTYIISIVTGIVYMSLGIILSFHYGLKPGGAIVVVASTGMILIKVALIIYQKLIVK